jgi:hypothetical protein
MIRRTAVLLGILLSGCVEASAPDFATIQEVPLRLLQADESPVVAVLPRGTPVVPVGPVSSTCPCWKVRTFAGTGWLYTRFIEGPL